MVRVRVRVRVPLRILARVWVRIRIKACRSCRNKVREPIDLSSLFAIIF